MDASPKLIRLRFYRIRMNQIVLVVVRVSIWTNPRNNNILQFRHLRCIFRGAMSEWANGMRGHIFCGPLI